MIQGGRLSTNECHYATVVDRVCIGGKAEEWSHAVQNEGSAESGRSDPDGSMIAALRGEYDQDRQTTMSGAAGLRNRYTPRGPEAP